MPERAAGLPTSTDYRILYRTGAMRSFSQDIMQNRQEFGGGGG
jgi:hypothetical protein